MIGPGYIFRTACRSAARRRHHYEAFAAYNMDTVRRTRRTLLQQSAAGFGLLGLRALLGSEPANPLSPKPPHFPPRAKRVIFLFMHGGPSSIDTFDPKPRLDSDNGKPVPFKRGLTFGEDAVRGLMKSPWEFQAVRQSGIPVSELFPNVATCVDDLCVVRSMVGDGVDHGAALLQLHTGVFSFRRPSMGSWALYGLGTENQNLPGFITIKPRSGHGGQNNWSSSFLPGEYQGTAIGNSGMKVEDIEKEPMPYLMPQGTDRREPALRARHAAENESAACRRRTISDPDLEARIGALELAFRMQMKAPEAFDVGEGIGRRRKSSTVSTTT